MLQYLTWPELSHIIFGVFLLCKVVGFLSLALAKTILTRGPKENADQSMRVQVLCILSVGAALWPLLYYFAAGKSVIDKDNKYFLIGFVWPFFMLTYDMIKLGNANVTAKSTNIVENVQIDANSLIQTAFAFAMLSLGGGLNGDKKLTITLVMLSLMVCISFIVPTPAASKDSRGAVVAAAAQRVLFYYSVGFIVTALALNVF